MALEKQWIHVGTNERTDEPIVFISDSSDLHKIQMEMDSHNAVHLTSFELELPKNDLALVVGGLMKIELASDTNSDSFSTWLCLVIEAALTAVRAAEQKLGNAAA